MERGDGDRKLPLLRAPAEPARGRRRARDQRDHHSVRRLRPDRGAQNLHHRAGRHEAGRSRTSRGKGLQVGPGGRGARAAEEPGRPRCVGKWRQEHATGWETSISRSRHPRRGGGLPVSLSIQVRGPPATPQHGDRPVTADSRRIREKTSPGKRGKYQPEYGQRPEGPETAGKC